MHDPGAAGALEQLSEETGEQFPHLERARESTAARLTELEERVAGLACETETSVVMFGSWARRELTDHSDFDWLYLIEGPMKETVGPGDDEVAEALGVEDHRPGKQGIFGTHAFCDEMVGKIGLDEDSNTNLTRRVLLMLESVPVRGHDSHRRCWEAVLDGYLAEARRGRRPPRFFLNDVVRYWRTICVDFVGKQRDDGEKWGTRNAKLRTSRKVLFAGGLLPILQCDRLGLAEMREFLIAQLEAPATDRLAYAFLRWGAIDSGARCLDAYDRWVGMLHKQEVRKELDSLSKEKAENSPVFSEIRHLAREIDRCLLTLLFETELEPVTRQFGIF